jgi:hypothetical protein
MSERAGRRFEITITLRAPALSSDEVRDFAVELDPHVDRACADHPTIVAYYVSFEPDDSTIAIGLRFDGMAAEHVEGVAHEVVEDSFASLAGATDRTVERVQEESALVSA